MNKFLSVLVFIVLVSILATPVIVSATPPTEHCAMTFNSHSWVTRIIGGGNCPLHWGECDFSSSRFDCGICCSLSAIYNIADQVSDGIILIVMIIILIGALKIIIARKSPEKAITGRNYIFLAAAGMIIFCIVKLIPYIYLIIIINNSY